MRYGETTSRGGQRGQAIVLVVLAMTVLLGMGALVIDLGKGWFAKRELQASADAAALAAAQELPSTSNASSRAQEYLTRNPSRGVNGLISQVTTKCIASAPGCKPVNAVSVKVTGTTTTAFARLFGFDHLTVSAKATACQPCGAKPLDIMVVFDRTGSMADGGTPNKIANAKQGLMTLLGFLDSGTARVGLAVLPPSTTLAKRCTAAPSDSSSYDSASSVYTVVHLSSDFKLNGALNPGSDLIKTINCQQPSGGTHYAYAIRAAQTELATNGRAGVQKIIIFLTDGAANLGPHFLVATSPYRKQPCRTGVTEAQAAAAAGTWVYTIGYSVAGDICQADRQGATESPAITPQQALQSMAYPDASNYYYKPDTGQLNTIFTQIAADISAGTSRLVDDNWG